MADAQAAQFGCESCGKRYRWKEELAGRRVRCKCGAVMEVPSEAPEGGAGASGGGGERCPECGNALSSGAVICLECGYNLQTGQKLGAASGEEAELSEEELAKRRAAGGAAKALSGNRAVTALGHHSRPAADDRVGLSWKIKGPLIAVGVLLGVLLGMQVPKMFAMEDPKEAAQNIHDSVSRGMDWKEVVAVREPRKIFGIDIERMSGISDERAFDAELVEQWIGEGKYDQGFFFKYNFSASDAVQVTFDSSGKVTSVSDAYTVGDLFDGKLPY